MTKRYFSPSIDGEHGDQRGTQAGSSPMLALPRRNNMRNEWDIFFAPFSPLGDNPRSETGKKNGKPGETGRKALRRHEEALHTIDHDWRELEQE